MTQKDKPRSTGRPRIHERPNMPPVGTERATLIVDSELWRKLKAIGYWERKKQRTVVHEALSAYIERYQKQHGNLKPIPEDADV